MSCKNYLIIKGEMSMVGPRPLLMECYPSKEQIRRHDVLPGITGLSQINGRNNYLGKRFELDIYYVQNEVC